MLRYRLERLADNPWARVVLGICILVAGIILGLMYHRASAVATQQASSVQAVCDQGGPAGIELTYRGTCQQAREVTADPVVGAVGPAGRDGQDGQPGIQGATGSPGRPGSNGVGVPGTPGTAGQNGAAGIPGVAGTNGKDGAPGSNGRDGQDGVTGPPGPTGPAGPAGPEGPAGPAGPQGDPGPAGSNGTAAACPEGTSLQPVTFANGKTGMGCVSPSS